MVNSILFKILLSSLGLSFILGGYTFILSKNTEIRILTEKLSASEYKIDKLKSIINTKDTVISSKDVTIIDLNNTINLYNEAIEYQNNEYLKAVDKLKLWKQKPAKIKYKIIEKIIEKNVNYRDGKCEDGLRLNKAIGEIKYEDI